MDTPHDLTVHGADGSGWYTFLLATGGGWRARASTEDPDRIEQDGRRASGKVRNGGADSYRFGGIITDANFDGNLESVEINGKRYDPGALPEAWQRDAGVGSGGGSSGGSGGSSGNGGVQDAVSGPDDSSHDPDGRADLDPPGDADALGGGLWVPTGEEDPQQGLVGRFCKTTRDRTVRVPSGESGGVQRALNRLPREIEHDVEVVLESGTHRGNGSAVRTGKLYAHSSGELRVRGEGSGATRVTSGLNASTGMSKQSHMEVRDVHLDGLSQFAGTVYCRDCRFSGFDSAGVHADSTAAISGKNGRVWAKNCVIGDPGDDYAIHSTIQEHYTLLGCTLRASQAAVRKQRGCRFDFGYSDIDAPKKFA